MYNISQCPRVENFWPSAIFLQVAIIAAFSLLFGPIRFAIIINLDRLAATMTSWTNQLRHAGETQTNHEAKRCDEPRMWPQLDWKLK